MKTRKYRRRINRPETADEVFRIIRDFMREDHTRPQTREQERVWDVLSALRGPDKPDLPELKAATTAVIRHAVFGSDTAAKRHADIYPDSSDKVLVRRRMANFGHFESHVRYAFEALNLKLEEVNE